MKFVLLAAALALGSAAPALAKGPSVDAPAGRLRGTKDGTTAVFKGILTDLGLARQ